MSSSRLSFDSATACSLRAAALIDGRDFAIQQDRQTLGRASRSADIDRRARLTVGGVAVAVPEEGLVARIGSQNLIALRVRARFGQSDGAGTNDLRLSTPAINTNATDNLAPISCAFLGRCKPSIAFFILWSFPILPGRSNCRTPSTLPQAFRPPVHHPARRLIQVRASRIPRMRWAAAAGQSSTPTFTPPMPT